jgi:hypothetical protein
MTDRRGDSGFSVAPRPVGGDARAGRRRTRRLGVAAVLLTAIAVIGVAWLGPRLASRPSFDVSFFATPTPSTSSSPSRSPSLRPGQTPQVTPLPAITLPDGVPQEGRVALLGDTLRVLDLRTGDATEARPMIVGRDAFFADPAGDGWACVCLDDGAGPSGPTQVVRLERIGADGRSRGSSDIATISAAASTDFGQSDVTMDVDLIPGRAQALLATATRSGRSWELMARTIDLATGTTGAPVVIGTIELPTPSVTPTAPPDDPGMPTDQSTLDGPRLRIAPDGRSAFLWGVAQHFAIDTVDATVAAGWRVELLADGSVGAAKSTRGFADMPMYCGVAAWASSDRFAWACPVDDAERSDGSYHFRIQTMGPDGRTAGRADLEPNVDSYFAAPLFDRANGRVYVWDPLALTIQRVDVHDLGVDLATFDPAETEAPGGPDHGGSSTPDWRGGDSLVRIPLGQLAGSTDGARLYGVAIRPVESSGEYRQGSSGVFVIDRATLALLDHWAPVGADVSVVTLPDGRVATSAVPGSDADGRAVPWAGALTLRDPADGRILARYGRLSQDMPPMIVGR